MNQSGYFPPNLPPFAQGTSVDPRTQNNATPPTREPKVPSVTDAEIQCAKSTAEREGLLLRAVYGYQAEGLSYEDAWAKVVDEPRFQPLVKNRQRSISNTPTKS